MRAAALRHLVPGVSWAYEAGAHLSWRWKVARADAADRSERPFRYAHPMVGAFVYHPADYLSRRLFLYGDFERPELAFAMQQAAGGGVILDVGANIGLYTAACARAAAGCGRVIALEPGPATFLKLSRTCSMLRLGNVTLINAAAGRASGAARLAAGDGLRDVHQHLADGRLEAAGAQVTVPVRRLDDLPLPDPGRVRLIKIDVEGHEVPVLEGAARILAARQACLLVECNPQALAAGGEAVASLWSLLNRTHRCRRAIAEDGSELPATESGVSTRICNTVWAPR